MNYFTFENIIKGDNSNFKDFYSWKMAVFNYYKGIKKYKEIIKESYKWTINCFIYNMTLSRIRSLLNLANEEIEKGKNKLEKSEINFLLTSIYIYILWMLLNI